MRECCRQVEAEVVSKSRNKIHQTQGEPCIFLRFLGIRGCCPNGFLRLSLNDRTYLFLVIELDKTVCIKRSPWVRVRMADKLKMKTVFL